MTVPVILKESLSLSTVEIKALLFLVFSVIGIIFLFRFFRNHEPKLEAPSSISGVAKPFRYTGISLVATGFIVFLGSKSGFIQIFPFAGQIFIVIGFGFYGGSLAAKIRPTKSSQPPR
ncbi:hypothetical protein [Variovorax rhizosphaerae]|uniref:Uncharacterized protein n=1 Tax=Variovorax rhizosphaerae TaxID=1836200 RepID=A0ABU8WUP1_9BURK